MSSFVLYMTRINKITPEILAQRKAHVLEILTRRPDVTLNHIRKAYGYDICG